MKKGNTPDYGFSILVLFLCLFGLLMMYSISPVVSRNYFNSESFRNYFFNNQLRSFLIGLGLFVVIQRIPYALLKKIAVPGVVFSLILMFALLIPGLGIEIGGATRWLDIGFTAIQPVEFLKVAVIIYFAYWADKKGLLLRSFKNGFLPFMIILGFITVLVTIAQRDLGTMVIIGGTLVSMYFIAGAPWTHFAVLIPSGLVAIYGLIVAFPHRISRVLTFLSPERDPLGQGYHITQVLIGIGSGGILGRGLGQSVQLYGYVPAPPTDSIFAIIAEELGFVGAMVLVAAFVYLAIKGFRIAQKAPDNFGRLLASGLISYLILQAFLNIAAMLSLAPLTGVPLPFISYGGSSLIATLVASAILINISRYGTEGRHEGSAFRWRHRWTRLAHIGSR